jgi:uncharacterized protein YjdB
MQANRRGVVALAILLAIACDSSVSPSGVANITTTEKIAVSTKALSLLVGQERQLSIVEPTRTVTWESDNPAVAAVSPVGLATALAPGIAHIVARRQTAADTATVTVVAAVHAVQLLARSINVTAGHSAKLSFRAFDAANTPIDDAALGGSEIRWSSTLPAIATVDSVGVVSALATGRASIVLSVDGKTDTATVVVVPGAVAAVVLSAPSQFSISTGSSYKITAVAQDSLGNSLPDTTFAWASSEPKVASVSQTGLVTGVSAGSAQIEVSSEGQTRSVEVSVLPTPVASINVSIAPSSLSTGQTGQAIAIVRDSAGNSLAGRPIAWSSSDPSVATVSPSGAVTAVGSGSATIRASIQTVFGTASVAVTGSSITAPAPTSGTLVTHDFEDGTLGPYFNPWHSGIDVVSDPTSTGHGKVARVHYVADGVTQVDDNVGVFPTQTFSVGLGDSVWFRGDFYIANTADGMRKLIYWGRDGYEPEHFSMVLELEPGTGPASTQLQVISSVAGPSNLPKDATYTGKFITTKQWHRLEIQLKVNSSFAAKDGILRVWLDGAILYDRTNMQWTDPLWTSDPGLYKWASWGVGYQMQIGTGVGFDEYRYWDNVAFAKTRLP